MRQLVLATGLLLGTASLAGATGGVSCKIDDENLTFTLSGEMGIGMGGPFLNYQPMLEIKTDTVPEAIRKVDLSKGLVHDWFYPPELRFHFYGEAAPDAPFSSFDLVLKTTASDEEMVYAGDYLLSAFIGDTGEVKELTGKVTCELE